MSRSLAGIAFAAARTSAPAGANTSAFVALKNPDGSGKKIIVTEFNFAAQFGYPSVILRFINNLTGGVFSGYGINKLIGASPSIGEIHFGTGATYYNGIGDALLTEANSSQNKRELKEPIVINPGKQIQFMSPADCLMYLDIQWYEIDDIAQQYD